MDPVEAGCLAAFPNDVDECVRVGGASQFARRDELAHGYSGVLGVHLARIIVGDGSYAGVKALSALDGGDCEFMASLVKSSGGDEAYFTESCRAALMAFAADASSIATTDEVAAKVPDALTFLDVPTGVFEAYAE